MTTLVVILSGVPIYYRDEVEGSTKKYYQQSYNEDSSTYPSIRFARSGFAQNDKLKKT